MVYTHHQKKRAVVDYSKINLENYNINMVGIILEKMPLIVKRLFTYCLFPPTLVYNVICWYLFPQHAWYNRINPKLIVGALPFYTTVPELYEAGVGGVVNCCDEYAGPILTYEKYGIQQLHLPVIDYTSPTDSQIDRCVDFCEKINETGKSVYIHCKAGKGRSVTFAICYIMKAYNVSAQEALRMVIRERPQVSKYIWRRECVIKFAERNNLAIREKQLIYEGGST